MTTTTPGCPATAYLMDGARAAVLSVPGFDVADVALTYEPRWSPEMMSPKSKVRFGITDGGGR
jgi:metal-sulfur cluster biosynthetic enzyme